MVLLEHSLIIEKQAKKVKKVENKYTFHSKKGQIGLMKFRVYNQTRKAKWCEMQVLFSKIDKIKDG
jgi:hypothetical protein